MSCRSAAEARVPVLEIAGRAAQEVEIAADLVVEDGDVPRRLIGDQDVILVLVQFRQDAAGRDHVVVGVGGEHNDALLARQLAASSDLGDQVVEHNAVEGR